MTDTFRALCAELVHLNEVEVDDWTRKWADAVKRTKAALAQPEPQGPTDEELITMWATTRYIDQPEGGLAYGRAVLARWGRPAIEPVPVSERLPGPEDCDGDGRCWWWDEDDDMWRLSEHRPCILCCTHWLPHWALPVPGVEGADA